MALLTREQRPSLEPLIRAKTREGEELLDFLLNIIRNDGEFLHKPLDVEVRLRATQLLLERGWGKPMPTLPAGAAVGGVVFVPVELPGGPVPQTAPALPLQPDALEPKSLVIDVTPRER